MLDLQRLKVGRSEDGTVYIVDRYFQTCMFGKSGSGKSSFLLACAAVDLLFKMALILIDPSGFLAQEVYSLSKGKALYCSLKFPISLNPMQLPYDPSTISGIVADAINQIVIITTPNEKFTVKMRQILDEAVKFCLERQRRNLISVKDYIENLRGDPQTRDGILARLSFLLNDDRMAKILCGNNSVKIGELIERRESFILDCFGMSEEQMIFAGTLISQAIKNYFRFERPKEYRPLAIYIDECHLFVNENFFSLLKEGRKFKIAAMLSTQGFELIQSRMLRLMLNVGNIISFRVGHNEARQIAPEMKMKPEDIQFLEKWNCAYLTPQGTGICKVSPPPFVKKIEVKAEVQSKSEGWFKLQPYQPA